MNSTWEKDYPLVPHLSEVDLDENTSIKKMSRLVGENKQVIDFGCATGYFSELLKTKGCEVIGVDVNSTAAKVAEQYCKQVIVADLDFVSLADILPTQAFDVAIFGDVLEHLRDPWRILKETKQLLKPEGYVVASIPNIAHGAIRLALLEGRFEYMELGILDNTHIRFFTKKTVEKLFEDSGYIVDVLERTKLPIFSGSEWIPPIDKNNFDSKVIQEIEQDQDADTLQFVIRAFPSTLERKYVVLNERYSKLVEEVKSSETQFKQIKLMFEESQTQLQDKKQELERSQVQLQHTQTELEQSQVQRHHAQAEFAQSQVQLQHSQAELEQSRLQLHDTQTVIEHSQTQLQQVQLEWEKTQTKLQQAQTGWEYCQNMITAMESSKFWKLRLTWFKLKRFVGLKTD